MPYLAVVLTAVFFLIVGFFVGAFVLFEAGAQTKIICNYDPQPGEGLGAIFVIRRWGLTRSLWIDMEPSDAIRVGSALTYRGRKAARLPQ